MKTRFKFVLIIIFLILLMISCAIAFNDYISSVIAFFIVSGIFLTLIVAIHCIKRKKEKKAAKKKEELISLMLEEKKEEKKVNHDN